MSILFRGFLQSLPIKVHCRRQNNFAPLRAPVKCRNTEGGTARLYQIKHPAPSTNKAKTTNTILQTLEAQVPEWTRHELSSASKPEPPRPITILTFFSRACAISNIHGASLPAAATTTTTVPTAAVLPAAATSVAAAADRYDEWYEWDEHGCRDACSYTCGPPS